MASLSPPAEACQCRTEDGRGATMPKTNELSDSLGPLGATECPAHPPARDRRFAPQRHTPQDPRHALARVAARAAGRCPTGLSSSGGSPSRRPPSRTVARSARSATNSGSCSTQFPPRALVAGDTPVHAGCPPDARGRTLYGMKSALTIRLDADLDRRLSRLAKQTGRSRSDLARDALCRPLALLHFEQLRPRVLPFAEARGHLT
jgi:ribbon-helix-helix CopG family protein